MTNIAMASPTKSPTPQTTCEDVVTACSQALADQDEQIKLRDLAIKEHKDQVFLLATQVQNLEEERDNAVPAWIYFALGVAGGVMLAK